MATSQVNAMERPYGVPARPVTDAGAATSGKVAVEAVTETGPNPYPSAPYVLATTRTM